MMEIQGYAFDMDGVIWDGDDPIPHAKETINQIITSGGKLAFVTNNASKSREDYQKRLGNFGITADISQIIVSSYAAGRYILDLKGPSKIHAMGKGALVHELKSCGHEIVDSGSDFVVCGLDETLTYDKVANALSNLLDGAELIGCAPDVTYLKEGRKLPGTGAFVVALEAASGKKATILGKPSAKIMEITAEVLGLNPEGCLMVGDKLPTDIAAGIRAGMKTALVLTGETTKEEAKSSQFVPDYIINDLRELPGL